MFVDFLIRSRASPVAAGLFVPFFNWSLNHRFADATKSLSSITIVAARL